MESNIWFLVKLEMKVWWAVMIVCATFPGVRGPWETFVCLWHAMGSMRIKGKLERRGRGLRGLWFLVSKHSWISSAIICSTPHHIPSPMARSLMLIQRAANRAHFNPHFLLPWKRSFSIMWETFQGGLSDQGRV